MNHKGQRNERRKYQALQEAEEPVLLVDQKKRNIVANQLFYSIFDNAEDPALHQVFRSFPKTTETLKSVRKALSEILIDDYAVSKKTIGVKNMLLNAQLLFSKDSKDVALLDIQDVTHHNRHLHRERAKSEALLESIPDGVIATDNTGKIIFVNEIAVQLFGYPMKTMMGRLLKDVFSLYDEQGQELPEEERPLYQTLRSGKTHHHSLLAPACYIVKPKSKKRIPLGISVAPIRTGEGITGAIGLFRDISQEKELDAMKTELISMASHQLRTPLTNIGLNTEMLLRGMAGPLSKEQRKYLISLAEDTKTMTDLINRFLTIARIEGKAFVIHPESTDLPSLVDQYVQYVILQIRKKGLHLETHYESLPQMNVDRNVVQLLLDNLISNAIKYTPAGGTIRVSLTKKGKAAVLSVQDTGYGIPKDEQPYIFTKMFRSGNAAKHTARGMGIGLYMVRHIVRTFGGKIWFESEQGKGTTFSVSIPLKGMKANKNSLLRAEDRRK